MPDRYCKSCAHGALLSGVAANLSALASQPRIQPYISRDKIIATHQQLHTFTWALCSPARSSVDASVDVERAANAHEYNAQAVNTLSTHLATVFTESVCSRDSQG